MNILYYYRKAIEKSRSFLARCLNNKRLDIFLLCAVVVVFTAVAINQAARRASRADPSRIDITVSSQSESFFGSETFSALLGEFEELHPGLRVLLADDDADIVFFDESKFSSLLSAASLAPLAPYAFESPAWALPLVRKSPIPQNPLCFLQVTAASG